MSTATEINARTDESLAARTAAIANAPAPAPKPRAPKTPRPPKRPAVPTAGDRARARKARPVTGTVAAYVAFLEREKVFGPRLTAREREVAGYALTLYGEYQKSAERRAARGA